MELSESPVGDKAIGSKKEPLTAHIIVNLLLKKIESCKSNAKTFEGIIGFENEYLRLTNSLLVYESLLNEIRSKYL